MKRFKAFKKLCSLALVLSMLVSLIPINVFATTNSPVIDPIDPVIDGSEPGSLTIYKYDKNYKEDDPNTEQDDSVKIPISDITFTIYQIFSITDSDENGVLEYSFTEDFKDFFDNVKINEEKTGLTVDEVRDMNGSELEALAEKLQNYIGETTTKLEDTTNDEGKAEFTNLDLGYYFVVEQESVKVENVITPFFVSIPMTMSVTEGETTTQYWEYDVVANPKNITNANNLKLIKTGKEGNNDVESLDGVKFHLEKLEGQTWKFIQEYETEDGEFDVTNYLDRGYYRLRETEAPEGYILDTYEFEVIYNENTKELEYYKDKDKDGVKDEDEIFTKSEGLVIEALNEKPTIEKVADELTAGLGETVRWTITTTVPSIIKELKTFKITDTLSDGLAFPTNINLKVFQGKNDDNTDKELSNSMKVGNTDTFDFTTEENKNVSYVWAVAGKQLVVRFNPLKLTLSEDITVSYDTVITEDAVVFPSGNVNEAVLEYSISTSPNSEETDTIRDDDVVYSIGLQVNKTAPDKTTMLDGAKFTLCKEGTTTGCHEGTSENGIIRFPQLKAGNYVLTEIQAPEEYNLLKEPIIIEITAHEEACGLVVNVIALVNGKEIALEQNNSFYYELTVVNNKGFVLPETGGMGTMIFTVAGLGMMGLAGAAYIALKRKESQN